MSKLAMRPPARPPFSRADWEHQTTAIDACFDLLEQLLSRACKTAHGEPHPAAQVQLPLYQAQARVSRLRRMIADDLLLLKQQAIFHETTPHD